MLAFELWFEVNSVSSARHVAGLAIAWFGEVNIENSAVGLREIG